MRRWIIHLLVTGCLLVLWWPEPGSEQRFGRSPDLVFGRGEANLPAIALTFDDGPSLVYTPQILELLTLFQAKATFFVTGNHARRHPQIIRAIAVHGHEIGNHTFSHPHPAGTNEAIWSRGIEETSRVLYRLGVSDHGLFRPPYSELTPAARDYLQRTHRRLVLWDIDAGDWQGYSANKIVQRVVTQVKAGAIIVFHDNDEFNQADRQPTVEALRILLPFFQAVGLTCETVSDLLPAPIPDESVPTITAIFQNHSG